MTNKEYTKVKEEYLKHKKWLTDNLDSYLQDKITLEQIESGEYPNYILAMPVETIEKHVEKIKTAISIYEIFQNIVKEEEDSGLHLVTKREGFNCTECNDTISQKYITRENHTITMETTCKGCGITYTD